MPSTARPSVLSSVWLAAAMLLVPGIVMADDRADGPNVADHPAVPRYAGACLIGSERKFFESLTLPLGKALRKDNVWTAVQTLFLEGAVTHLLYAVPAKRTPLEVFRNVQEYLPARGYEVLYICEGSVCGSAQNMTNLLIPEVPALPLSATEPTMLSPATRTGISTIWSLALRMAARISAPMSVATTSSQAPPKTSSAAPLFMWTLSKRAPWRTD